MATAFEREVHIRRPADEVWAALTDWQRAPSWMRGVERIIASGPVAAGTELTFTARGAERPAQIVEVADGRLLVLRSEQGPVAATYRYEVESVDPAASVCRLTASCDVRGPLRLVAPLIRRAIRRADAGQPAALRALLEG